jgi:cytidylate kinase
MDVPLNHKVFMAMFDTIKKLAARESCVIVGRCADYDLADMDSCISVFIHGDLNYKLNRLIKINGLTDDEARSAIKKTDKRRASYYNYFSSKKWGDARTYNLALDSSKLTPEGCSEMIISYLKLKSLIR